MILTHKKLVNIAYKWVLRKAGCGIAFKEFYARALNGECPDVIGFGPEARSVLIECKVSRADFLRDKNKKFRKKSKLGMGKYRYYCCPTDLIKVRELPDNWGLLYVEPNGKIICIYDPYGKHNINKGLKRNLRAEQSLMYTALRRLYIKGYLKTIYDKQYTYSTVNQLIKLNSNVGGNTKNIQTIL